MIGLFFKRLGTICLVGCWALGCSSSDNGGSSIELVDILPGSGEVSGWEEDPEAQNWIGEDNPPGPQVTTCLQTTEGQDCAEDWVDGAISYYPKDGAWLGLAVEQYKKDPLIVTLIVHELKDQQATDQLFVALEEHPGKDWTPVDFGAGEDRGKILEVLGAYWWILAAKGNFLVETQTGPTPSIENSESEAKAFAAEVLKKIP